MEINRKHPEYGVWHMGQTQISEIPVGALLSWKQGIRQYGFHLGDGKIAWIYEIVQASDILDRQCRVICKDGNPIALKDAAARAEKQVDKYLHQWDFLSACIGDVELTTMENLPVWIYENCGRVSMHPVAKNAVFEKKTSAMTKDVTGSDVNCKQSGNDSAYNGKETK